MTYRKIQTGGKHRQNSTYWVKDYAVLKQCFYFLIIFTQMPLLWLVKCWYLGSTFPRLTVNRRFITNFQGKSLGNVLSCDHSAMHTTVLTLESVSEITTKEEYLTWGVVRELKGLFTWKWGTPGGWGNPLRWGNPHLHIISYFNLITFAW